MWPCGVGAFEDSGGRLFVSMFDEPRPLVLVLFEGSVRPPFHENGAQSIRAIGLLLSAAGPSIIPTSAGPFRDWRSLKRFSMVLLFHDQPEYCAVFP